MQELARRRRFGAAVKSGWSRLLRAAKPRRRGAFARRRSHPPLVPIPDRAAAPDPVLLTILAVNRLAPATLRTVANGKAVSITVSDPRIGEIFRAALAEMQKTRLTDRLIDVAIEEAAAPS